MIKVFFYRIFCGFFLGISVFAPGFSGSLLAIVMGIYQDIVRIASNPFRHFKQNIKFCLPLGIGAVISAILFVISFTYLFDTYEKATYLLFVGLIAGNLPVIFDEIKKCGFKKRYLIGESIAFALAISLSLLAIGFGTDSVSNAENVSSGIIPIALGGLAAGVSALIPGMSVSMILIISGVYEPLLSMANSLMHMNFTYLIPFGLFGICAIAGLVFTSKGIKTLFERFPGFANSVIFGFMSGSLIGILIHSLQMDDVNFNWLTGGLALAAGLGISVLFVVLGKVMNKQPD